MPRVANNYFPVGVRIWQGIGCYRWRLKDPAHANSCSAEYVDILFELAFNVSITILINQRNLRN